MTPPAAAAARRAAGAPRAPTRPRVAPPRPRRISGPVRPPAQRSPRRQSARGAGRARPRARPAGALDGVSRSGALDRLIRGRIWIGVIAFALIGIVTLQLLVLQLNASIGRALGARGAAAARERCAQHRKLGTRGRRTRRVAGGALGMQLVPVGALRFLTVDPRADIARAAAAAEGARTYRLELRRQPPRRRRRRRSRARAARDGVGRGERTVAHGRTRAPRRRRAHGRDRRIGSELNHSRRPELRTQPARAHPRLLLRRRRRRRAKRPRRAP